MKSNTKAKAKKSTSKQKQGATKKLTAAQRLEVLENLILQQDRKFDILADELDKNRGLVSSLAKRLNAAIDAGEEGSLNNDTVNKMIINGNVSELKSKIDSLIDAGVLVLDKDLEVGEKTFVVGQEIDEDGTLINPRVQFAVGSLDPDFKKKILGKKTGDLLKPEEESTLSLEITEVYAIVTPEIEKKFEEAKEA